MAIEWDLTEDGDILQFLCPTGVPKRPEFIIEILDNPDDPRGIVFEISDDYPGLAPVWACTLQHPDSAFGIHLSMDGNNRAQPAVEIDKTDGGYCTHPINDPPPDTWLFPGDPDPKLQLYFSMLCDETWVKADNAVPFGIEPGYPLQVMITGGPIRGKKIRIVYPLPGV